MMLTIFCFVFFGLSFEPDTTYSQSAGVLENSKRLVIEGDTESAISLLEKKIETEDPLPEEVQLLAQLYYQSYRFPDVIDLRNRFESIVNSDTESIFFYAGALAQTGQRQRAVQILEDLREREKRDPRGRILLSGIYFDNMNWNAALPIFNELAEMIPGNLFIRTRQARVLDRLGQEEQAAEILTGILGENPSFLPALLALISIRYSAGETQQAKNLVDRGLWYYPEDTRLWNFSAQIAYREEQFIKAIEHWNKVVELGDHSLGVFRNLGLCHYQVSQPQKALENFGKVLALNPDDMISLMYSAMVHRQLGQWEEAAKILDYLYNLTITDRFTETLMQRAVVAEQMDNPDAAIADYKLVKMLDPEKNSADFYLAALYDRLDEDHSKALQLYEQYLENEEVDPQLEEYARGRIRVLREQIHFSQGRQ